MCIMPDAPAGVNLSLVQDLRDLADFLEAHPELPAIRATAWVERYRRERNARAELTTVAEAFGPGALEQRLGSDVEISGQFGSVRLRAEAKVSELRDEPEPEPDYEPIIEARS